MSPLYINEANTHIASSASIDGQHGSQKLTASHQPDQVKPSYDVANTTPALDIPKNTRRRPEIQHSSTDPTPASSLRQSSAAAQFVSTNRNRSPYSRSHLRSRSSGSSLCAPAMTRSHSWAGNSAGTSDSSLVSTSSLSPSNSIRSTVRARSPLNPQDDMLGYSSPSQKAWYDIPGGVAIESIQEDSELDITPRGQGSLALPLYTHSRSSSLRRRPASPLRNLANSSSQQQLYSNEQNMLYSGGNFNSAALGSQRFNEAYPTLHHYASSSSFSSISSTPTSQRSRSPSISSLETIEDVPDLESEAIEAERIERLKFAAEREERAENGEESDEGPQRRSLDVPRGFGFSRGGNRERKRWSVCGGERRGDLDLETIWED